jgi:hypothetical protein
MGTYLQPVSMHAVRQSDMPKLCLCAAHCSMALGFLFMGAGTLTFGTSPPEVAALVVSLFPHMPASTTDHRCHLQVGNGRGKRSSIGSSRPAFCPELAAPSLACVGHSWPKLCHCSWPD